MKQGRTSLLIGLVFLVACLVASKALLTGLESTWANTLRESLTIAGWVAMWRPMQIYLYDWWPLRQKRRIYAKLSRMPVEVVLPKTKKPAADQQREHGEAHPHDRCPTLQASRPPRAHQERRADTDIDHARELAALDTSEQISDGFGATLGAVQVLLDLGLPTMQ